MSHITVEVPPLSRKQIREFTYNFRKHIRCEEPYFPIVEVLEFLLYMLEDEYEFLVEDNTEMGPDHGRTYPDQREISVREDVYDGACAGKGRDRMTLAHELGHYLLHRQLPLTRRVDRDSIPRYRSSEWQANCFGGELLIPACHISKYPSLGEVTKTFQVSEQAAMTQLQVYRREGYIP